MTAAVRTKMCSGCGQVKPVTEFWRRRAATIDGYQSYCKVCSRAAARRSAGATGPVRRDQPRGASDQTGGWAHLHVRLSADMVAQLAGTAERLSVSRSRLVADLLTAALGQLAQARPDQFVPPPDPVAPPAWHP